MSVEIAITIEEVPGKGWLAFAPEVRATATGESVEEAVDNLLSLLNEYPEALYQATHATHRHVEIKRVPVPA